jgi:protein-tyrosine phosphatase
MWDALFLGRMEGGDYPAYPGDRAFLVELQPQAIPPRLQEHLFRLRLGGQLPVVAHVERYEALWRDSDKIRAIGRSAALLVNLPALGGAGGWLARRRVRKLVRAGLVHAAATDSHRVTDVPFIVSGISWIRSALGDEMLRILLEENPRRILAGELPEW